MKKTRKPTKQNQHEKPNQTKLNQPHTSNPKLAAQEGRAEVRALRLCTDVAGVSAAVTPCAQRHNRQQQRGQGSGREGGAVLCVALPRRRRVFHTLLHSCSCSGTHRGPHSGPCCPRTPPAAAHTAPTRHRDGIECRRRAGWRAAHWLVQPAAPMHRHVAASAPQKHCNHPLKAQCRHLPPLSPVPVSNTRSLCSRHSEACLVLNA